MGQLSGYRGVAWNPATASENRIHADDVARQYGFRGGLVPGVTVYAIGVEPALREWGSVWLREGGADIVLQRPLYEGQAFEVETSEDAGGLGSKVVGPESVVCATLLIRERAGAEAPSLRGDSPAPPSGERPEATRTALERLREEGMGSVRFGWDGRGENGRYRADASDMPDLVRADREGLAHPSFTLGLANWVLSGNVRLGPWIHVESRVANHAPLPLGTETVTEARVTDLFEKRGHEFVDLDFAVFTGAGEPVLSGFHRAIYRLRDPD